MKYLHLMAIVASLFIFASMVQADSIDVNLTSIHHGSNLDLNEDNFGLGITKDVSKHLQIKVGAYNNSYDKVSSYVFARLKHNMGHIGKTGMTWDFGINVGFITGYDNVESRAGTRPPVDHTHISHYRNHKHAPRPSKYGNPKNANKFQFVAIPTIALELTKHHGFEIGHMPAIGSNDVAVTTLQYKWRLEIG